MVPTANRSSSRPSRKRTPRTATRDTEPAARGVLLAPIIDDLATLGETEHWVVSCYLKLEPRDRSRGKYLIKLKNRIKQRLAAFDEHRPARGVRNEVARDLERIRDFLEHPTNLPTGRGIALFASEPLGLFSAIPLARVFRSRLAIAHTPLIRELAALDDEFGRVVCAVYDRTAARFYDVTAREAAELPGLTAPEATRGEFRSRRGTRGRASGGAGHGEHNFNQRIREEKHRHYAQIAHRLFSLSRDGGTAGIVLAGTGADVSAVESHLHPYVREALLGTVKLNPKSATPTSVMDAVLTVRQRTERTWEERHLDELREGLGSRWAVNGVGPSLDALSRGQVRTLLVNPAAELHGYRCRDTGRLVHRADQCAGQGSAEPVADVIDDAIEEALRQDTHVDVVEHPDLHDEVDGLAALLRFTLS